MCCWTFESVFDQGIIIARIVFCQCSPLSVFIFPVCLLPNILAYSKSFNKRISKYVLVKTMRQLQSMTMKIKIKKQLWLLMFAFCKGSTKVLLRYAWILKVLADSSGEDWNPLENFLLFFFSTLQDLPCQIVTLTQFMVKFSSKWDFGSRSKLYNLARQNILEILLRPKCSVNISFSLVQFETF